MITGAHLLLYSKDPEADRAFFRNILQFASVDAGGGWLIFKLPVTEAAFHPSEGDSAEAQPGHQMLASVLYLMCDDLASQMAVFQSRNVRCTAVTEERWGRATTISLPSGGQIGLYQPLHPTALELF
jgi:hypothetical protein